MSDVACRRCHGDGYPECRCDPAAPTEDAGIDWAALERQVDTAPTLFWLRPFIDANRRNVARIKALEAALAKIDAIRNSIIGHQSIGWSEHIYPLVAALEEGGFKGQGYDEAREEARTLHERIRALEEMRYERDVIAAEQSARIRALEAERDDAREALSLAAWAMKQKDKRLAEAERKLADAPYDLG